MHTVYGVLVKVYIYVCIEGEHLGIPGTPDLLQSPCDKGERVAFHHHHLDSILTVILFPLDL